MYIGSTYTKHIGFENCIKLTYYGKDLIFEKEEFSEGNGALALGCGWVSVTSYCFARCRHSMPHYRSCAGCGGCQPLPASCGHNHSWFSVKVPTEELCPTPPSDPCQFSTNEKLGRSIVSQWELVAA